MEKANNQYLHLDGDIIRKGLCKDLGFSYKDRKENLRRVAEISRLFNYGINGKGIDVLATFVSPTNGLREMIKNIVGPDNFKLIYVQASLNICEKRDVKGMYKLARQGKIKSFTGIDDLFEDPLDPDLVLDTVKYSVDECVNLFNKSFNLFNSK